MVRSLATVFSVVAVGVSAAACAAFGPTTQAQVCGEFDELGERFLAADGLIDNLVFLQAGVLADIANRYEGAVSLAGDASALEVISDADTTTGLALAAATDTIAELCGHVLGAPPPPPEGGDVAAGSPPTADPTSAPVPADPSTEDSWQEVTGPGGISVSVPAGWTVGGSPSTANRQAADPADPQVFVRLGASAAPDVPLLTEIQHGETGNPNVRNRYQRVQLVETSFLGLPAVDWEFTFVKDGMTRHALGRYWRDNGYTYVIYLSAPDERWPGVRSIFTAMAMSATVY